MENRTLLSQNITLVFDTLDLSLVETSRIKDLSDEGPTIIDGPNIKVAFFPSSLINLQIADRRILLSISKETEEIEESPIWKYTTDALKIMPDKSNLIAYGFNFDLGCIEVHEPKKLLKNLCISNENSFNKKINGKIEGILPRFIFTHNNIHYELSMEALEEGRLKTHFNAHFVVDDSNFPKEDDLRKSYYHEFDYFNNILSNFLEA